MVQLLNSPTEFLDAINQVGMHLESAMKSFLIKQNTNSSVKKSTKKNHRKIGGECLTAPEVVDRVREHENEIKK